MALAAMAAVSGCAVAAGSSAGRETPRAVISQASGDLRITNSRDGQAIFQAQGLAPGRSVSGTVELSNSGTLAGGLGVEQLDVQDQPGVNGGRLSDAVYLDVQDVTSGNLIPVFAGQLGTLQSRALGSIAPGEARTYRFTASLPDGGAPPGPTSGDNAYAGSALTVRYSWKAIAPDPLGLGGGGGGGSVGGGGHGGGAKDPISSLRPKARFYVVSRKLLKRGWLDVMVICNRACQVTARAQLPKVKRARKAPWTRRRSAALPLPDKRARIRLKLSRRTKLQLNAALRRRHRVSLRVHLRVVPAGWGRTLVYTKRAVVKRPRKNRR
jgi:spore coat-associated protein N